MSEPLQLARAVEAHDADDVSEAVLQQASHALILKNYELPNTRDRWARHDAETFPLDTIDAFFAALRIITSIETGYAQLLVVPSGWARQCTATLTALEGVTTKRYPPNLYPVHPFYGNQFPYLSDSDFASVRSLFQMITAVEESGSKSGERLKLAIKRLNSCFLRENEEDAILDATIGLEILLSDGETQEVTHKLALRLAALSSLIPKYDGQAQDVFRNVKNSIYAYRSAVVHGDQRRSRKKREIKLDAGGPILAVKIATEYLGLAVQATALNPDLLEPANIDERLLLRARQQAK